MATSPGAPVRHLWVLRHGKAASDAPWGGTDRERPLTGRGRRDASALGRRLAGGEPALDLDDVPAPALAICSAAVRTRQTADLVVEGMGGQVPLDAYRSLYEAETPTVLQYLREVDEEVEGVLLVGHNPTMYQLVWELLADHDDDLPGKDRDALEIHGFPTCALAVLSLGVDAWEDVTPGSGRLAALFKPPY
jgi:phosphohistidine phosphatase